MLKRLVLVLEVISILIFLIMIFAIQLDLANNLKWSGDSHLFPLLYSFIPFVLIMLTKYIICGKFYLFLESFKLRESAIIKRIFLFIQIAYSIPLFISIMWLVNVIILEEEKTNFLERFIFSYIICAILFVLTIYIKYLIYGKVFLFKFKEK